MVSGNDLVLVYNMLKILAFGANGQIGRSLLTLASSDLEVIPLGRKEADLSDPKQCADHIRRADVDAVINAAAYTDVNAAENDEVLVSQINGFAPGAMARACAEKNLPFLHISTDYVFDGSGTIPFAPEASPNPINAYGRSKQLGEDLVRAAKGKNAILRTSWVFSEHGTNFVKTMLRLAERQSSLSIVGDQMGGPTPAIEIADALVAMARAMAAGHPGGTYHFAGQPMVSWAEFAQAVFLQARKHVDITMIASADLPSAARRPLNSRLNCASFIKDFGRPLPDWRLDLKRVIKVLERG